MSRDNDDVNVPLMGPADPDEEKRTAKPSTVSNTKKQLPSASARQGDTWVTTLILVLLTAGCGVLGFLAFGMQSTLMEQRALLSEAQEQVSDLEARLQLTSDIASQSGKSLQQRVDELTVTLDQLSSRQLATVEHNVQLEASIIQLEQTTQALAEQATDRSNLLKKISDQQVTVEERISILVASNDAAKQSVSQIADMRDQLAELTAKQDSVEQTNAKQNQALTLATESQQQTKEAFNKDIKALGARLDTLDQMALQLQTQLAIFDETSVDRTNQLQQTTASIEKRVSSLESKTKQLARTSGGTKTDPQLVRRVSSNEQAIAAIDGTRRQMNSELLSIRQQLNALALKVGR